MGERTRVLTGLAAAAAAVAAALGGCGPLESRTARDEAPLSGRITAVRLAGGTADVLVSGADDARAGSGAARRSRVVRLVRYRGERPRRATHAIEDGVLVLGGCGHGCSAQYRVSVPAGTPVHGRTSSGTVRLFAVGPVHVATENGRIELDGVDGAVDVRTHSGPVEGRGLAGGPVRARTSTGSVTLEVTSPQDVTARTRRGAVTLSVPQGRYRVSARTGNGHTDVRVPDDPSGGHRLDVSAGTGAVTVAFR